MQSVLGDLQIVVEQHSDVLRNNALPFRFLITLRVLGFLLSLSTAAFSFLSLTPIRLFSIEVWRLITSPFVGANPLLFAWTIASLHVGTNIVRQANSNESLLRIYAITQVFTTLFACAFSYLWYAFSRKTELVYEDPLVDFVPINAAVLVLIKQFLPDSIVIATPLGRVKYMHLPGLAVLLTLITSLFGITKQSVVMQCAIGVQVSWTYLRYFNPHETDEIYGDSSEHFTWASMWPRRLQPVCTVIGRIVFRSLVRFGVCKRRVRHVDLHSLQSVAISMPGLESSARDAERRRQKALRELNERLSRVKKANTGYEWGDDEDAATSPTGVSAGGGNQGSSSFAPANTGIVDEHAFVSVKSEPATQETEGNSLASNLNNGALTQATNITQPTQSEEVYKGIKE
ncbi:hypothetical protein WR25_03046 [Diploscapter pachys]|uniref:Transmembrane protein 115 n=1 Tax=Diploscapter pachys TaxID=2018661 RepID=A0A2A2K8Q8_9BILA|nr:hypothetical protein WR25_03046 [Diploscapter pachys]